MSGILTEDGVLALIEGCDSESRREGLCQNFKKWLIEIQLGELKVVGNEENAISQMRYFLQSNDNE